MKVLPAAFAVLVVLAASACGSSGGVATPGPTSTNEAPVTARLSTPLANLPPAVRTSVERDIRAAKHPSKDATVDMIEVYGPGTRTALNAASGGGLVVTPTARKDYYLTVLYGHFVCVSCERPAGGSDPRGSVATRVWSPTVDEGDSGIMRKLPRAVSRLHRLIRIRIGFAGRL